MSKDGGAKKRPKVIHAIIRAEKTFGYEMDVTFTPREWAEIRAVMKLPPRERDLQDLFCVDDKLEELASAGQQMELRGWDSLEIEKAEPK